MTRSRYTSNHFLFCFCWILLQTFLLAPSTVSSWCPIHQHQPPSSSSSSSRATTNLSMSTSTSAASKTALYQSLAEKARAYLTASTDPFHAVANAVKRLEGCGFSKWTPTSATLPGGKYYYTVQQSTLVAFTVGAKTTTPPDDDAASALKAFRIIGGHTDSPNLKVKPRSKCTTNNNKHNCIQLGVECYGGGLWHTWLDRDLSLSGRVLVRDDNNNNKIVSRLVQFQDPLARVSSLCIHLQTAEERKALVVNKETHTVPIVASQSLKPAIEEAATAQLNTNDNKKDDDKDDDNQDPWLQSQEPLLLQRIAQELNIDVKQIADWDLSFYDVQPAAIGGLQSEFLYSGRLDNLATVFCSIEALCDHSQDLSEDSDISMVCAFDHEEVGSVSSHGAGSPVLAEAMERVSKALNQYQDYPQVVAKSYCMSIDQAHAVHPNYASKHESAHGPTLNSGIVIKSNSNQRYATNSLTAFIVRELGRKLKIPVQEFVVKNDCPCGSTIGPTISARTGLRTIDAGMPQLSMHSCREVMGVTDLTHAVTLFKGFFKHFKEIDDSLQLD